MHRQGWEMTRIACEKTLMPCEKNEAESTINILFLDIKSNRINQNCKNKLKGAHWANLGWKTQKEHFKIHSLKNLISET